jgi:nucleoside-diphosphate-sugar epimerase
MDIFVTGATGVIGRPAVAQLAQSGHQVRALARSEKNAAVLRSLGAEPVRGELWDDDLLRDAVRHSNVVLHLATKIPPLATIGKRDAWRETDRLRVEGMRRIVDAALNSPVRAIVYPSICFAYSDNGDRWIDATNAELVMADYYRSTFVAEAEARRFTEAGGGRGIVLRMGLFYGPTSPQSVSQLRYARFGIASVPGAPEAYHPFLAIDDAASAIVAAVERDAPADIYDIVDDDPLTTEAMNQVMAAAVGRKRLRSLPEFVLRQTMGSGILDVMARSQRVSNRRFKEATRWRPQVGPVAGWQAVAKVMRGVR